MSQLYLTAITVADNGGHDSAVESSGWSSAGDSPPGDSRGGSVTSATFLQDQSTYRHRRMLKQKRSTVTNLLDSVDRREERERRRKVGREEAGDSDCDSASCSHVKTCRKRDALVKIRALEAQLEGIRAEYDGKEGKQQRLRADKEVLEHKIQMLDDNIGEMKRAHAREIEAMQRAHREEKGDLETSSRNKIDELKHKIERLDEESRQAKAEVPRLRGQLDLLKEDKEKLEARLEAKEAHITHQELAIGKLRDQLSREENSHQAHLRAATREKKELEGALREAMRSSRPSSRNTPVHQGSRSPDDPESLLTDALQQCNALEEEKRELLERIAELEDKLNVYQAKQCEHCYSLTEDDRRGSPRSLDFSPLATESSPLPTCTRTPPPTENMSLAAELAHVFNKDRSLNNDDVVKDALADGKTYEQICIELKQQQGINEDLQAYLNRLLLLIMENIPELLEVKS